MLATMAALALLSPQASPIKVEIRSAGTKYTLLRGGKPFTINGVGGNTEPLWLDRLKESGGNAIRTWGAENLGKALDDAHKRGITVTIGIWLGHVEHGFNWGNPTQVKEQFERTVGFVRQYRNHPALLMWALGNEMEVAGNDNRQLWRAIDDLAQIVKREDPNHPVMSVVAEVSPEKIKNIKSYAPTLDLLGVNSYGGLRTLSNRLKEFGWTKPYVVTEFGPLGPWEVGKTPFGTPLEPTSTEKQANYLDAFEQRIKPDAGWCLGSYAFLWGHKQEQTPTWFGMWLPTGEKTGAVDEATRFWTGSYPKNRAPSSGPIQPVGSVDSLRAGDRLQVKVSASDPNGDKLSYRWEIRPEVLERKKDGIGEKTPDAFPIDSSGPNAVLTVPQYPGTYRVFVTVGDGRGAAAVANLPFRVVR